MLWKKEPNSSSYTNIFGFSADFLADSSNSGAQPNQKCDSSSAKYRQEGNQKVSSKMWHAAMQLYNKSLCYAEIGGENVSLALANRSLCFLKLQMYDKCIADIELAIEANYPKHLLPKLEERRTHCLNQMTKCLQIEESNSLSKLDYDKNENFPGLTNIVQMEYNSKYGRHLVAKSDIDVGKVILAEDAFVSMPIRSSGMYELCGKCGKNSMNFIACEHCAKTVFCSRDCAESDQFHKISCGATFSSHGYADGLDVYVIRSVLVAANIFSNIGNLITFVEDVVNDGETTRVPTTIADMESKYRMFLKLNLWLSDEDENYLFGRASQLFLKLSKQPVIKAKIRSMDDYCFLMHLSLLHIQLIYSNSFQTLITGGIFLIQNHMNHSCKPNVLRYLTANKTICITSRKIKEGDQIFTNYMDDTMWSAPNSERQGYLYRNFGFHCYCEKCSLDNWPISSERIKSDQDYQYFLREKKHLMYNDKVKCTAMKKTCLRILAKYSRMPWNTELDAVCSYFQGFLNETALYA